MLCCLLMLDCQKFQVYLAVLLALSLFNRVLTCCFSSSTRTLHFATSRPLA
jgi:hypothetical protein